MWVFELISKFVFLAFKLCFWVKYKDLLIKVAYNNSKNIIFQWFEHISRNIEFALCKEPPKAKVLLPFSTFFPPFWSHWMKSCSRICLLKFVMDWNKSSRNNTKQRQSQALLRVAKSSSQIICDHKNCNFKRFKVQNCIKPIKKYKSGLTLTCFQYYLMFFSSENQKRS